MPMEKAFFTYMDTDSMGDGELCFSNLTFVTDMGPFQAGVHYPTASAEISFDNSTITFYDDDELVFTGELELRLKTT